MKADSLAGHLKGITVFDTGLVGDILCLERALRLYEPS